MTEVPSKWAMERARKEVDEGVALIHGEWTVCGEPEDLARDFACALDAARREALDEAARLCDASEARIMTKLRKLEKPNADLAGAAAVGGADTAAKLARRIRALMDKEPSR